MPNGHDPTIFVCPICSNVLRAPLQCKKGHAFCGECIGRWLSENQSTCPMCSILMQNDDPVKCLFAEQAVNGLTVYCQFRSVTPVGCGWTGPLSSRENHAASQCQFNIVACPLCFAVLACLVMSSSSMRVCARCSLWTAHFIVTAALLW